MKLKAKQKIFLALIFASVAAMVGCSQPSNDSNISTSTSVSTITPTGVIQGVLIDAITQQPIVGAVIDIGVATAYTNGNGQFVLNNVPATQIGTGTAQGTTLTGNYEVSINLKGVTSPVNMSDTTIIKRYPDFSFKQMQVEYTSDVGHPLNGIAKGYQLMVGKQDANIAGVVSDAKGQPVSAGYTVTLYSNLNAQNSATGSTGQGPVLNPGSNTGHIVSTTTTDASGKFTFANIEAGMNFMISAQDTANTLYGETFVTAPADNATRTLTIQNGDSVVVLPSDAVAPVVVSVTPENNSDITPAATSVVFTFSEPIKQTSAVADVSPSNPNGLYSKVDVNFTGPKPVASNLAHSLAWSADRKTLTVNLPAVGASSMYRVDISPAVGMLTDDAGNAVAAAVAPATPTTIKQAINFTTNGGLTAVAPTVAMTNSASINASSLTTGAPVAPSLEWLPTSGAKGYNVYRTKNEVWGTNTVSHPAELINTVVAGLRPSVKVSNLTDTFRVINPLTNLDTATPLDYVEYNAVKLTYSYVVKAVNSDGVESAASNAVVSADVVAPNVFPGTAVICGAAATCNAAGNITTLTVPFDEQMDETSATTAANYTSTVATFSGASYNTATRQVVLTLTTPITLATVPYGYISTGANGISNTLAGAGDTQVIPVGAGQPNTTCVTAGLDGVLQTAGVVGDDVITGVGAAAVVSSGANGICQTAIAVGSDDVQAILVNNGLANTVAVSAGANGVVNTAAAAGDVLVPAGAVVTVAGVKDVAGNAVTALTGRTKYNADGTAQ